MPALEHDLILKLDPADHAALLAARIAERDASIAANDAERKRVRLAQDGKATKPAEDAKAAALATAKTHEDAHAAKIAEVKAKHAATDLQAADEGHDIARGVWEMKAGALLRGQPPVERKRIAMADKDADDYTAAYRAHTRAGFEGTDLMRQIEEYKAAHPALFAGSPGEPPPVDPAYEKLKVDLEQQRQVAQDAMVVMGAITGKLLAGEPSVYYTRVEIATGDIVLGDKPEEPKEV